MSTDVLLVDDEESFVLTLAKRLTLRRFNVFTATNAGRAFATLDEHRIDVVVLDVKMPDLDGIEATKTIKDQHPLVEVILLTGHANLEASLEGMKLGAFDYLLKPVNIDELVYKIEDASRKKELQEEKIRRAEATAGNSNEETSRG
jgi:DNA-binding NtrC family response regulator